jgi:hypothetical protein
MNPRYFQSRNWDLRAAISKICESNFLFPVLQLQPDSDPAQPKSIFADLSGRCPNFQQQWITNASHFDNFDQPEQVADAINKFVKRARASWEDNDRLCEASSGNSCSPGCHWRLYNGAIGCFDADSFF